MSGAPLPTLDSLPLDTSQEEAVVRLRNLRKTYSLGTGVDTSLKSVVLDKFRGRKPDVLEVLDGIDLDIHRGQALGICGVNGAGKSTLLKIVAGIIPATSGTVEVRGRVASLLELGAGFHPEMSGEENVLLNGSILGIGEKQLRHKMASIFRTAGLERFAKTPIKHYSSGMVQRLGFAIASHLDPDVLILDEIFAVGDILFQHTAKELFERFKALKKTIILVSHDLGLLEKFCNRVLILANGKILMDGPPKIVTHQYAILSWQHQFQFGSSRTPYLVSNRVGDQRMRILEVQVLDEKGEEARVIRQFSKARFRIRIASDDPDLGGPCISLRFQDRWSQGVCQSVLTPPSDRGGAPKEFVVELVWDAVLLAPGYYSIELIVQTRGGWILDMWAYGESFHVISRESATGEVVTDGFFYHPGQWLIEGEGTQTWERPDDRELNGSKVVPPGD
jgi:ABC-type polysaccharide/polyol phosphate transport system ATPase subunit